MKVLLVGGDGYIGSEFKKYLRKKKIKFISLDNFIYFKSKSINKRSDLRDNRTLNKVLPKVDNVIVLAGLVGDPITKKYPIISKSINNIGLKKLIDQVCSDKSLNIKKLIFISTCSNYGLVKGLKPNENSKLNPLSLYAKDKVALENHILKYKGKTNVSCTILRFATAFGLSKRMRFDLTVNEFVKILHNKKILKIYDADTWRPYCHVKDFSKVMFKVLKTKKNTNFEIYNVGSNKNNFTKRMLVKKISNYLKTENEKIIYLKNSKDKRDYNVNFLKLRKKLKVKNFYSLDYGIKEIILYLKKNKKKISEDNFGNYKIQFKKKYNF